MGPPERKPVLPIYEQADFMRTARRLVMEARALAGQLGDRDQAWDLLAVAAELETYALGVEAELEASA